MEMDSSGDSDDNQFFMESFTREDKKKRDEVLKSVGAKEFFEDGSIWIDMKTCKGIGCQLCINACPTYALYWRAFPGEITIIKEICIFCTACVWNCIVDDCIQVSRKRSNGEIERFSNPRGVLKLLRSIDSKKWVERVKTRVPKVELF
jgi:Na+-translocating ferredoxin:NAD+ oxidoreductase RNF subunit RnfB